MRYFSLLILLLITSIPTSADDIPEIKQVALFGRGTAYTLAWRPDGEVLAVGSSTGVWFFDEEFNEIGQLAEDTAIDTLEWSPDGERLIAFASSYQTENCQIIISNISQDVQSTSQDRVLDYCARSVDWSSDGKLIAIGIADKFEIEVYVQVISAINYNTVTKYHDIGMYVAFSPDSNFLALNGHFTPTLTIKDVHTNVTMLEITDNIVGGEIIWDTTGDLILTNCNMKEWEFYGSCMWDTATGELYYSEELSHISWIPNSDSYITWGSSPYDYNSFTLVYFNSLETDSEAIAIEDFHNLTWHPSGTFFTVANTKLSVEGYLSHISLTERNITQEKRLFSPTVKNIRWNPDNTDFLTLANATISFWHWDKINSTTPFLPEFDIQTQAGTYSITNTDARWEDENTFITIATTGGESFVFYHALYDSSTGNKIKTLLQREGDIGYYTENGSFPRTSWSNDLSHVAYSDWNNLMSFYIADELFAEKPEANFEVKVDQLRQIEWSPDNTMIATAGNISDSHFVIDIWDTATGEKISSIQRSWMKYFSRFVWSPDSRILLVIGERLTGGGANRRTVSVYKVGKNYDEYTTGYDWYEDTSYDIANIMNATWSPDSQMVAVSFQNAVKILNINNGIVLAEIPISDINTLDWHENGQYLAGGASNGTIYVWDVSALMAQ